MAYQKKLKVYRLDHMACPRCRSTDFKDTMDEGGRVFYRCKECMLRWNMRADGEVRFPMGEIFSPWGQGKGQASNCRVIIGGEEKRL